MAKKIDLKAILSAAAAGAGYNFAIDAAAKQVDFVNQNYLVTKSLGAGLLGSGMLYFGKSETTKAAGYALLGVAGASGAAKLATVIVTSGEPMQGRKKLQRIKNVLVKKSKPVLTKGEAVLSRRAPKFAGRVEKSVDVLRALPNQTISANPFSKMAYADLFY